MTKLTFVFLLLVPSITIAQWHGPDAPDSLSFQGFLADTSGAAVADGDYNLLFKMYKGSSAIWQQNHLNVPVKSGVFNVMLAGSVTWPLDTVAFNKAIDLGITINGGTELAPRTPLTSAAYALGMRGMYAVGASDESSNAPNLIGGASNNYVASGVMGATIGGGGGVWGNAPVADSVLGIWGTVGGGAANKTNGSAATVGGGQSNKAIDSWTTVGGGQFNRASASSATVGGGQTNVASNQHATVGGGRVNTAGGTATTVGGGDGNNATFFYSTVGGGLSNSSSGQASTVSGGSSNSSTGNFSAISGGASNSASGAYTMVPGGFANSATRGFSFAAGQRASANHPGTFVWADSATAAGSGGVEFASTGDNQFLIRAGGGVGIGTNNPANQFHVARSVSAAASVGNHVAVIDNTSTGTSADVLALRVGRTDNPTESNAFISFKHNGNTSLGFIRGTGDGGIQLISLGADYAEYLPHLEDGTSFEPGDVVGVYSGQVSHRTKRADQIMVVSTAPIVVGNNTTLNSDDDDGYSKIAFIGQAPVRVRGAVASGDFLIPSGADDGTAVAISPEDIAPDQLLTVFATAWESSETYGVVSINAAIGIDQSSAGIRVIEALHQRQEQLEARLAILEAKLVN